MFVYILNRRSRLPFTKFHYFVVVYQYLKCFWSSFTFGNNIFGWGLLLCRSPELNAREPFWSPYNCQSVKHCMFLLLHYRGLGVKFDTPLGQKICFWYRGNTYLFQQMTTPFSKGKKWKSWENSCSPCSIIRQIHTKLAIMQTWI